MEGICIFSLCRSPLLTDSALLQSEVEYVVSVPDVASAKFIDSRLSVAAVAPG